jgi:hypothetical protein
MPKTKTVSPKRHIVVDVFHTKVKQKVTWRSSRQRGSDKNEPVTTILGVRFLRFSPVKNQLN